MPQSLNRRHPCTGVDTMADSSQLIQGGSKVRRSCQSTIVGGVCTELRHSDRALRTAWFEKGILKWGLKKKHWIDFYHYRMDVYIHFQQTFKFKQLVKWILHQMTPLKLFRYSYHYTYCPWCEGAFSCGTLSYHKLRRYKQNYIFSVHFVICRFSHKLLFSIKWPKSILEHYKWTLITKHNNLEQTSLKALNGTKAVMNSN